MKKMCLLLLVVIGIMQIAWGQNKKGNWIVGTSIGAANFSKTKNSSKVSTSATTNSSENSGFTTSLTPSGGYYFTDRIVAGLSATIGYSNYKSKTTNTSGPIGKGKSHLFSIGVGPFGRFYLGKNNGKGMPFTEIGGAINAYPGYKTTSRTNNILNYTSTYKNYMPWNAGVKLGYEHFLTGVIGFQYYLAYTYSRTDYSVSYDYVTQTDYSIRYKNQSDGISVGAGLVIHVDCDKKKGKK